MRRIALYSHDAEGLGRIRRSIAIAEVLSASEPTAILLVAGTRDAGLFSLPAGTDLLTLPAVRNGAAGDDVSRALNLTGEQMVGLRAGMLRAALTAFAPDALVVDELPGGVGNELLDTLPLLRAAGTRTILGLPEVLDDPEQVAADWKETDFRRVVRQCFDAVWVYGDPRIYDPVVEYGMPVELAACVRHTGYIDRAHGRRRTREALAADLEHLGLPSGRLCVCMAGGGEHGGELLTAFAAAMYPPATTGVILTGPFLPDAARARLAAYAAVRADLLVLPFTEAADRLVRLADRVIAMGGYNTMCEILASRRRALIVPRVEPKREQLLRAERLAALGLVDVLHPSDLSPASLGAWLASPDRPPHRLRPAVDLDGLHRVPQMLAEVLAQPAGRDARVPLAVV